MVKYGLRICFISIFLATLLNCEEPLDRLPNGEDLSLIVVESTLTNESKRHEVKLSKSFQNIGETPANISGATVTISDGTTMYSLQEDINRPGVYLTDSFAAVFDNIYELEVIIEGTEYTAMASAALATPLVPFEVNEVQSDSFEYIYHESDQPSMLELIVDWDEADSLGVLIPRQSRLFFYTLNIVEVNEIFAPDKERVLFPRGANAFRRQYSLTQDHQRFLRSLLAETDWRGGLFDVAPGNVITNISTGAVGYFAISMVQVDNNVVN